MIHKVTLIPGDGIGPEITEAATAIVAASGVHIDWDVRQAGAEVLERLGTPLPDDVLRSIRASGVALKGPITTPIGTGFRSVNVALRQVLDLYACLRPCRSYKGVRSRYSDVDLVIVRENTEDVYAGIEFEPDSEGARSVRELAGGRIREGSAISVKPISGYASRRIVRFAFEYAVRNGRHKVTAVTKANIMKCTDGLFLEAAREVAAAYEGRLAYDECLVDNMCMQLVQVPEKYDVLVMPNLYGDILSDLCAGLVGGLGVTPGANIGDDCAVFEPTHGSAPKYQGLNKANPTAMILSAVMMLRHLGEGAAADRIESALAGVIAEGRCVTYDLTAHRTDLGAAGTAEMARAVIAEMAS